MEQYIGEAGRAADLADLDELGELIGAGRYFQRIPRPLLRNILRQGTLIDVEQDHCLIREGDASPSRMYILVEGSVAIVVNGHFILRLAEPGDVVGEMAVIQSTPRSADVITETPCRLISFPSDLFEIDADSPQVSILYVLFAHIMAAKLRMTTAQSLIRKSQRVTSPGDSYVGIIDACGADRATAGATVRSIWPEAMITEFASPAEFYQCPNTFRFDLIIADVDFFDDFLNDATSVANFLAAMKLRGAHVMIVSQSCQQASRREFLIRQGAEDVVAKPCLPFDLEHAVSKARISYYKNLELDRAESAAETDQLTGLANRRRLEEFLEALVLVYPDQHRPFSLILLDVDHFKHYNDNHGHLNGDKVLQALAGLLPRALRRGDLAARFGGEEFLMVLPDCDKPFALQVAEKLRLAIEAADLPHQHTQPGGNLTATFGVATFPHDARDTEALFRQADECLYRGKHLGRNVVVAPG